MRGETCGARRAGRNRRVDMNGAKPEERDVQCLLKYNNLDALVHDLVHDLVACMQGYTKNS